MKVKPDLNQVLSKAAALLDTLVLPHPPPELHPEEIGFDASFSEDRPRADSVSDMDNLVARLLEEESDPSKKSEAGKDTDNSLN